ncbi:MAG TPA: hypothetical protein VFO97_01335 [Desertimonas sp.]|nr:hypothetical protein [Desertimonas sp.]
MNKVRLIAACAALTLVVAACGDDDDDASDDTTAAPAATAASAETEDAPSGTDVAAGAGDPEVAADCQTLFTFATEDMQSSEALSLQVGEEITDEHREQMDELIGQLEGLDLQTDQAQDARDLLIELANEFSDADEVTEDLGSEQFEEFQSFATTCAPYLSAAAVTGN